MKVRIVRNLSTDEGVFGNLTCEDGKFTCVTLELPYRNNAVGRSCIPSGTYRCLWLWSEKHGRNVYHVQDVPGRTVVEIHSANLAGDIDKGYVAQLEGCISPGANFSTFEPGSVPGVAMSKPQKGISSSAAAQQGLEDILQRQPFDLEIVWKDGPQ